MNNDAARKVLQLQSGAPVGSLTPISAEWARDERGALFKYTQSERYEAAKRRRWAARDKRHFSFTHMQHIREITQGLSNKYCGYVLLLQPYIAFKSNVLVTEGREDTPLTIGDLAQVWDVSKRTARVIINELEVRSIVFETSGTFTINERYHFRKKAADDVDALIKTYFTTLKSFDMTAADLGFVYKLLPYVHYDTNVICADPFVENPEDVRFLNEKAVADIAGMNELKAAQALARLRKSGIIGEWFTGHDRRDKLTVLNPYVFYRKRGEPDGTLRTLFAAKRAENVK
ncbi:hypothetical protein [Paenibacillus abyssi]|uniref:Uncharacterized protein n=1 Tax=Paenibacillus abyssi TaxID=1340531 RepID=A0A917CH65_9BACL|nr:hypothetical protein [Paenibacillus abyssi]GGF88357.1 hypothetical protein GCM10010916_02120 [Paenibacillus abyssi]